jgi:hypothetical protein
MYTAEEFGRGRQMGWKCEYVSVPDSYFAIPIESLTVDSESLFLCLNRPEPGSEIHLELK